MVLFVDQDSPTVDSHQFQTSEQLILPSYVNHFLYASRRRLPFITIFELLKDIYKLTKISVGGKSSAMQNKASMQQVHPSPMTMCSGISNRLMNELDTTVSCLASQHWLREKCLANSDQLLEKIVDRNFTAYNVRV